MKFPYHKLPITGGDTRKPLVSRPYLPVYLLGKSKATESPYYALLDSGADRVIFSSDLAEQVGIEDFKNGRLEQTIGIGSQVVDVYFHDLKLKVLGESRELAVEVGFADNFFVLLLGRSFFMHYKSVIFSEGKEMVELKA